MNAPARYLGQGVAYGLFALALGYFSTSPPYRQLPADYALIKLSFTHAAQRKLPCRKRSAEELARLAPNMRIVEDCPRERSNVLVEMDVDGQTLYRVVLPPSGLAHDGAASLYRRVPIRAGVHHLLLRLKDREQGDFNFVRDETVRLEPGRVMVIDFKADAPGAAGWIFHGAEKP